MNTIVMETGKPLTMEEINGLVKKAFGIGFKGNFRLSDFGEFSELFSTSVPAEIRRRTFFPIPFFWENVQYAGEFTSKDGSALSVLRRYEGKAREYGDAYEKLTGRKVSVSIIEEEALSPSN